jgi:hypothetical protein
MAKRKHSTALFEVITKGQPYAKPRERRARSGGLLATASRWFKKQLPAAPQAAPVSVAAPAPPITSAPPPALPAAAMALSEGALTLVQTPPEDSASPDIHDAGAFDDSDFPPAKVTMAVDHESRRISLHMTYTSALLAAAAVVVVVGLTIIVLQHMSRNSALLLAEKTSDKIREGPAHRDVLDVPRRALPSQGGTSGSESPAHIPGTRSATDNRAPVPSVAGDGKRYIGLNYVIVQSYPLAEEKMAKEAAALLNKEGVSCTVETGVKGYLPLTVVGLQGFDKQSSPAFKAYVQRIQQISAKSNSGNHSFKAFAPVAKKWDKQD